VVTFEVSPDDAEMLITASETGKLKLVLRPEGGAVVPGGGMDEMDMVVSGKEIVGEEVGVATEEKKEIKIDILRGNRKSEQFLQFDASASAAAAAAEPEPLPLPEGPSQGDGAFIEDLEGLEQEVVDAYRDGMREDREKAEKLELEETP
jgi:hypothetical protein